MPLLQLPTDPVDRTNVHNISREIAALPIGTAIDLHGLKIRRTSIGVQWRRASGPRRWEHETDLLNIAIRLYNRAERRLISIVTPGASCHGGGQYQ